MLKKHTGTCHLSTCVDPPSQFEELELSKSLFWDLRLTRTETILSKFLSFQIFEAEC